MHNKVCRNRPPSSAKNFKRFSAPTFYCDKIQTAGISCILEYICEHPDSHISSRSHLNFSLVLEYPKWTPSLWSWAIWRAFATDLFATHIFPSYIKDFPSGMYISKRFCSCTRSYSTFGRIPLKAFTIGPKIETSLYPLIIFCLSPTQDYLSQQK